LVGAAVAGGLEEREVALLFVLGREVILGGRCETKS
jgi:hypothetical protein